METVFAVVTSLLALSPGAALFFRGLEGAVRRAQAGKPRR